MSKTVNVAYGSRNITLIYLRRLIHRSFITARWVHRKLYFIENEKIEKILLYPLIINANELADLTNKLLCSFPFKKDLQIYIPVSDNLVDIEIKNLETPLHQERYLDSISEHICIIKKNDIKSLSIYNKIFVHKWWVILYLLFRKGFRNIEIIDKNYFGIIEGNVYKKIYFDTFSALQKDELRNLSMSNFIELKKKLKGKEEAYLFLTGPTFSTYTEFEFPNNSIKILCNTTIKNTEFLDYIGSFDILAFTDPVFHFSSNKYASLYRKSVVETILKYDNYITVPEATVPGLIANYPQLKSRVIGFDNLPVNSDKIVIPDENNLLLRGAVSVLTFFMLPVASALSKKIYLIGADGRQPSEKYFWKHNSSVQYDDLMQSVFYCHPSFFRDREYGSFYEEHCAYFEEFLSFGEKNGVVYKSLSESFIPAVQKRVIEKND